MKVSRSSHYSIKRIKEGKNIGLHVTIDSDFSLFRYRAINKYTTEQFLNDELFATSSSGFNDPYDSKVMFSSRKIKNHIKQKLLNNESLMRKLLQENGLKLKQINDLVNSIYEKVLAPNYSADNNVYAFACFSTDVTQEIMWAHYANLATGFALEYSYYDLVGLNIEHQKIVGNLVEKLNILNGYTFDSDIIENPLLPVVYQNNKYDITNICNDHIDEVLDRLDKDGKCNQFQLLLDNVLKPDISNLANEFIQNVYFRKKNPWSYENEWRLICYNYSVFVGQINNPYVSIGKIAPKAIYLGENISSFNKRSLIAIARDKQIDVYEMKTIIVGKTLKLKAFKL